MGIGRQGRVPGQIFLLHGFPGTRSGATIFCIWILFQITTAFDSKLKQLVLFFGARENCSASARKTDLGGW